MFHINCKQKDYLCVTSVKNTKFTNLTNIWIKSRSGPGLNHPQIKLTPESRFTHLQTLMYGLEEIDLCESETYEYQSRVQEVG
jgi:hypothetical protein